MGEKRNMMRNVLEDDSRAEIGRREALEAQKRSTEAERRETLSQAVGRRATAEELDQKGNGSK